MTVRFGVLVTTLLLWAGTALAEVGPEAEVAWSRALALEARGDEAAGEAFEQACEAGSDQACLRLASAALADGEVEVAEEWLRLAREVAADDLDVRLALARIMALRGNDLWATRELQALEGEGREVSFELGYLLHELDQHEQAAERLVQAAEQPGGEMAALYAASSLERLGRDEDALEMARRASRAADPEVAEPGEVLSRSLEGELSAARRTLYALSGTVSVGYDSNPVLGPDDLPSHAGGARLGFRGHFLTEPLGGPSWALGGRIDVARDQSFDEAARAFDLTALRGQLQGRFAFGERLEQRLQVAYRYGIALLDGGQGVEEEELYVYNESHQGAVDYTLGLTDRLALRLRAVSGWMAFHNRARSGVPLRAGVGLSLFLLEGRVKLFFEGGMAAAWTRSPRYQRLGPTASIAGSALTPWWDLEVVVSWAFTYSPYPDSVGVAYAFDYTRPEVARRDVLSSVSVELGRRFLDGHLRVALRYRFFDASSTIADYDYSRHVVDVALTGGL